MQKVREIANPSASAYFSIYAYKNAAKGKRDQNFKSYNSLASYSRSLRDQGLVDSAVDEDFEQDLGKPKNTTVVSTSGEGKTKKKKGFNYFSVTVITQHISFGIQY